MPSFNNSFVIVFIVLALGALVYLVLSNNSVNVTNATVPSKQNFESFVNAQPHIMHQQEKFVDASESIEDIEQNQGVNVQQENVSANLSKMPSECYPKDVLSSADLLPRDSNSQWAQVNPSGQGSLADQNFLTSGFHIGINTVGQSLRNANRQLRSEPLNPQVKVSPWQQTTIEPDINRRPFEVQGDE